MPQSEVPVFVAGLVALVLVILAGADGWLRVRRLAAARLSIPGWIRVEFFVLGVLFIVGVVLVGVTFSAE